MRGAKICGCAVCGWRGFPHRYWCPACGSLETIDVVVKAGVVEQATTVRRAAGRPGGAPVTIGSVRTDGGALIVVRLEASRRAIVPDFILKTAYLSRASCNMQHEMFPSLSSSRPRR